MTGFNQKPIAAMLENTVYFKLRRSGYEACIEK